MNETTKKGVLIAVVVLAVAAAAFGAKSMFSSDKMEVTDNVPMPAGFKSEKERALEGKGDAAPAGGKEVDLSGG
ncbi:MAG: hypothetical protein ACO1SV_27375 [Fimbriimonas sp.]